MPAGTIRAAYGYEYMAAPYTGLATSEAIATHVEDLVARGINTFFIKMLTDNPTPIQVRYWKTLILQAEEEGLTIYPLFNWHSLPLVERFSHPDRRYQITAGPLSIITELACPIDPNYVRGVVQHRCQSLPGITRVGIDVEFPSGGSGGFHNYVNPCHCNGCLIDYWRSTNSPSAYTDFDIAELRARALLGTPIPSNADLLTFEQQRLRFLVNKYARQAGYKSVVITDTDSGDDTMTPYIGYGFTDAELTTTILAETTYTPGVSALAAVEARYTPTPVLGGLWLKKWSPANLTTEAIAMGSRGYWLFTTYSMWLGQTAQTALASTSPYKLPLGTPGSEVAEYWAAIAAANV